MTIFLYFVVIILNIINVFKKNKLIVVELFSLLFLIMFIGGNNHNADYLGYLGYYEEQNTELFEYGYLLFSRIFYSVGLPYQVFVVFIFFVVFSIIYIIIKNLHVNFSFFVILYLLTMSFLDAVQIRQAICFAIFTLAVLLYAKNKKMLSIVVCCIACTFQITAIIFLPLFFFELNSKRFKSLFIILILALLVSIATLINNHKVPFVLEILLKIIPSNKLVYFKTSTRYGFILGFFYYSISLILCSILYYTIKNNYPDKKLINNFAKFVFKIMLYTSIVLPFIIMNNNFNRVLKFPLLGMIMLASCCLFDIVKGKVKKIYICKNIVISKVAFIGYLLIFIVAYFVAIQVFSVIPDVFDFNVFFSL